MVGELPREVRREPARAGDDTKIICARLQKLRRRLLHDLAECGAGRNLEGQDRRVDVVACAVDQLDVEFGGERPLRVGDHIVGDEHLDVAALQRSNRRRTGDGQTPDERTRHGEVTHPTRRPTGSRSRR